MSVIGAVALTLVSVQLAATLVFQFAPFRARFHRLDLVGALPRWRFFMPGDDAHDHAILMRERGDNGTLGEWRPVWESPERPWWRWLWSHDANDDAHLSFAVATLDRRIAAGRAADPATSRAYALILDRCRRSGSAGGERQFALARVEEGERRVGYVSPFHAG